MAWSNENKYMLAGNISTGLTLDSSNTLSGSPLAGTPLYGSGTYGSQLYQYAAYYYGEYESTYYNNKLTISTTGNNGDITYSYCISDDGITYTSWPSPINIVGTTTIYMRAKYFKIRFYFHSTLWGDSDSIAISSIDAAFTVFQPDTLINANEMNGNFQYLGNGNWMPVGNTTLSPTNGSYNLGSSSYKWNNAYLNELNISGEIANAYNIISSVVLSAVATSIEITGLNSDIDDTYNIVIFINNNNGFSGEYGLYFNGVSGAAHSADPLYVYANNVLTVTAKSFVPVSMPTTDTSTAKYGYCNIIGRATPTSSVYHGFGVEVTDFSGSYVMRKSSARVYIPIASINTITSLKIIGPTDSAIGVGSMVQIWAKR